jgi:NAD(P)H-nitrite reductase large subunit
MFMREFDYLIIGGGMTGDAAAKAILETDDQASIGLIGEESTPPYDRPPLSKDLWKDETLGEIWRETESLDIDLILNRRAVDLDTEERIVTDDQGEKYRYGKLLLATGSRPVELPQSKDDILYFRTVEDYRKLNARRKEEDEFAVIGGGFIGAELAAGLTLNDAQVTMIFPEAGIHAMKFPQELSDYLDDYYRQRGVEVWSGELVEEVERRDHRLHVRTKSGRQLEVDFAVAGLGVEPNTELAEKAGLKVEDGILVDPTLRTSDPHVFAAGDVASFYNSSLDRRIRVEHEDNALTMGEMAGRSMTGEMVNYDYLPYFYSDLFDLGYEALGILDADLEIVTDWDEPFQKGVIYYLDDGRVRGVVLWNVGVNAMRRAN